ncbi:MAG: PQQ-dependent sugar dehydrogenase [Chlorobi bacterium]|nr:PQQ-dependent sugar dehydrogenase [Chlorobiota bacterium]
MKKLIIIYSVLSALPVFSQQYLFDVLVSGIREPTAFAILPNGNFIVNQKHDSTKIYNAVNGQLISCFWNFRDSLYDNPETGVIGICIDPNFNSNHCVYILYTDRFDSTARVIRLTENSNVGTNPFIVTKFRRNGPNYGGPHLAGNLRFGPLNKLYVSIGEAGQSSNAQLLTNPLGKILRINSDGTIPTDNPFYDDGNPLTGNDDRIWAYGLRNSYDFCFSPINDSIYAPENNNNLRDEFNYIRKGKNYGWPICQTFCNPYNPLYKDPMDTLPNTSGNLHYIPTGVIVYNGSQMPELYGKLLIGGARGSLIKYNLGNAPAYDTIIPPYTFVIPFGGTGLTTVLQGTDGFIYYAAFHSSNGSIVRIKPNPNAVNNNGIPVDFSLSQNYPNPFNPVTKIKYEIPKSEFVTLKIYNVLGIEIAALVDEQKQTGSYEIDWDASNYPSGVYFYELHAGEFIDRKKMILVK